MCFQHACKRCNSPRTTASHDFAPFCLQGYGVYRFEDKYGANVDGYSPIYTPDQWTESGDSYKLGTKGLIAWWVAQDTLCNAPDLTPLCDASVLSICALSAWRACVSAPEYLI